MVPCGGLIAARHMGRWFVAPTEVGSREGGYHMAPNDIGVDRLIFDPLLLLMAEFHVTRKNYEVRQLLVGIGELFTVVKVVSPAHSRDERFRPFYVVVVDARDGCFIFLHEEREQTCGRFVFQFIKVT